MKYVRIFSVARAKCKDVRDLNLDSIAAPAQNTKKIHMPKLTGGINQTRYAKGQMKPDTEIPK